MTLASTPGSLVPALFALLAAGCATAPATRDVAAAGAVSTSAPAGCPAAQTGLDPASALAEANRLIAAAGEHPSDQQLAEIVARLRGAALSGNLEAQRRFGLYVVGYFLTDELFWPSDRATAVTALAMLRVAFRRGAEAPEGWSGLARDPVVLEAEELSLICAEWLQAAVAEAAEWERCHP